MQRLIVFFIPLYSKNHSTRTLRTLLIFFYTFIKLKLHLGGKKYPCFCFLSNISVPTWQSCFCPKQNSKPIPNHENYLKHNKQMVSKPLGTNRADTLWLDCLHHAWFWLLCPTIISIKCPFEAHLVTFKGSMINIYCVLVYRDTKRSNHELKEPYLKCFTRCPDMFMSGPMGSWMELKRWLKTYKELIHCSFIITFIILLNSISNWRLETAFE